MIGNIAAGLYGVGVPPVTSSYESIASTTVGASSVPYVEFSSIPSTYKHLQIRAIGRINYASVVEGSAGLRFNSDTANNYATHLLYGDGGSTAAAAITSDSSAYGFRFAGTSATSGVFGISVIDVLDYTSTSKNKTIRQLTGIDNNGSGQIMLSSGLWFKTPEAINTIRITGRSGDFLQYSSFALYGIKD